MTATRAPHALNAHSDTELYQWVVIHLKDKFFAIQMLLKLHDSRKIRRDILSRWQSTLLALGVTS